MSAENILVVAVDGLRAAALGAYGNTSFPTPVLDEFAAESLLFDWCFAEAVELPAIYRSLWLGEQPLAKSFAAKGFATTLVTDDPTLVTLDGAEDFANCVQLTAMEAARAGDVSQTVLARLFAAASEQIQMKESERQFVLVHSRGMYGPWDAPLALQEPLLAREEGDPPPEDALDPPDLALDEASDPDVAFRWSCAYAAQVMALDACIDGLCRSIDEAAPGKWLMVLCGVRGFPLGEHGRIGGVDSRLYAEQLHVPLLWRFVDASGRLARNGELTALADLTPALLQIVDDDLQSGPHWPEHDALFATAPEGRRAIRTAEWSLQGEPRLADDESSEDEGSWLCELYVRPDDRWEANDVAGLCPEVVEALLARLAGTPAR